MVRPEIVDTKGGLPAEWAEHLDGCLTTSRCYHGVMRTTIILERDVLQAVQQLRRRRGVGLSDAVNELIRQGLARQKAPRSAFRQRVHDLGLRIDVRNVAEALELLDGPAAR